MCLGLSADSHVMFSTLGSRFGGAHILPLAHRCLPCSSCLSDHPPSNVHHTPQFIFEYTQKQRTRAETGVSWFGGPLVLRDLIKVMHHDAN